MKKQFYANAKLLISGEYLVTRGARALVVPLRLGQRMEVETQREPARSGINWTARVMDHDWFNATLGIPEMNIVNTNDKAIAGRLAAILKEVMALNKELINSSYAYDISTHTRFDQSWGMGSSAALIANLAQWARISPLDLFFKVSRGSGYDVAAAMARGPFVYSRENLTVRITPVEFHPPFRHHLWFLYQGHKQDTSESLEQFDTMVRTGQPDIEIMNGLTDKLIHAGTLSDFIFQMHEHEEFLSDLLGKKPVQEEKFSDFRGGIKSLGAWGGDFVLVASDQPPEYVKSYFSGRNMETLFSFEELVLS